ncbi:MAG TPA: sulfotransferase domain-containing protein [Solirubrobacteraceae bacterium]
MYEGMLQGFHGARRLLGRSPGRGRVLPDFVIIGAAKAGTTSVYAWLCEHPFVKRARRKEIDYFTYHHYRGADWYRHHFPPTADRSAFATEHGRPFITGEASPSYLLDESAPRRMAKLLPDIKLIVALRNPADRAYSQFQMRRRDGEEPIESFADALEVEDPRFAAIDSGSALAGSDRRREKDWRTYLSRGRYAEQLERWFACFPVEQFHIVELGELAADPLAATGALYEFLGLPPGAGHHLEARFRAEYEPMRAEVRDRLLEYFRPHNERLYELLGRQFAWDE